MKETVKAELGKGIYNAADAARVLGIPYNKARHWFNYHAKFKLFDTIGYQYHFKIDNTIAVDFLTLIEMYVFYTLKENNIKTKKIIKAHEVMSNRFDTPYPFALKELYSMGDRILFEDKDSDNNELFVVADQTMQFAFNEFIPDLADKIVFGDDNLASKFYPLGKEKTIVVTPENQFGMPRVEGTNVLPETINDYYIGGESKEFIADLFNLSLANINHAIEYCQRKAA